MTERSASPEIPMKRRQLAITAALVVLAGSVGLSRLTNVSNGEGSGAPRPPATDELQDLAADLEQSVRELAMDVGQRNVRRSGSLRNAGEWLGRWLGSMGLEPTFHDWTVGGQRCSNIEVVFPGGISRDEIVVIGTHYDSYRSSPSANATASGTVALLQLIDRMKDKSFSRTVKFVFFCNGERPQQGTEDAGPVQYAKAAKERGENIVGVLTIGSVGAWSNEPDSQDYLFPWNLMWPSTGDFVSIMGNPGSRELVERATTAWKTSCSLPLVSGSVPSWVPGIQAGDHDAFQAEGFSAILLSDTGAARYEDIRTVYDQFHRIDYEGLARLVLELEDFLPAFVRDI